MLLNVSIGRPAIRADFINNQIGVGITEGIAQQPGRLPGPSPLHREVLARWGDSSSPRGAQDPSGLQQQLARYPRWTAVHCGYRRTSTGTFLDARLTQLAKGSRQQRIPG